MLIYFASFEEAAVERFFGAPAYRYTVARAFEEGLLSPVDYRAYQEVVDLDVSSPETIKQLVTFLAANFSPEGKKFISCTSADTAHALARRLRKQLPDMDVQLIPAQGKQRRVGLEAFLAPQSSSIAIGSPGTFVGITLPDLKEVVLLSRLKPLMLSRVLSLIQIGKREPVGIAWDFAGNLPTYQTTFGDNASFTKVEWKDITEPVSEKKPEGPIEPPNTPLQKKLADPKTDKPAKQDLLGRDRLVHTLRGIIDRHSNKHLIIALFARWGAAKVP